jgi:hypothetical protein
VQTQRIGALSARFDPVFTIDRVSLTFPPRRCTVDWVDLSFSRRIPMKQVACLMVFAMLLTGVAVAGEAEAVTVEGKVLCAKCKLGEKRDVCQNVLVVETDEEEMYYYMAATDANKEFGDVCMATPMVRATGTVSEKDGQRWLAASKIEKLAEEG